MSAVTYRHYCAVLVASLMAMESRAIAGGLSADHQLPGVPNAKEVLLNKLIHNHSIDPPEIVTHSVAPGTAAHRPLSSQLRTFPNLTDQLLAQPGPHDCIVGAVQCSMLVGLITVHAHSKDTGWKQSPASCCAL